jgi:hypothetical protein
MNARGLIPFSGMLIVTLSCATTSGLRNEALDEGVVRIYQAPLRETIEAGREAMVGSGIEVKEVNDLGDNTWMIMGNKGGGLASYGELVRMVLSGPEDGPTTVRVLTKKRMATNVFAEGDWSKSIYDQMDLKLGAGS